MAGRMDCSRQKFLFVGKNSADCQRKSACVSHEIATHEPNETLCLVWDRQIYLLLYLNVCTFFRGFA